MYMKKKMFVALVALMSLSLIGIIFVQSYWINTTVKNKNEQFSLSVQEVLGNVSFKIQKQEKQAYFYKLQKLIDSLGQLPNQTVISELFLVQKDANTNETFLFRSGVIEENYNLSGKFFEADATEDFTVKRYYAKSETTFFDELGLDQNKITLQERIKRVNQLPEYNKMQLENLYEKLAVKAPIHKRLSVKQINLLLSQELTNKGLGELDFEFAVYASTLATSIHTEDYELLKKKVYATALFPDLEHSNFSLRVTFPDRKKFLLSSIVSMSLLSLLFTTIIILTFALALYQLMRQRKIAEIKSDFINNMTHEFKTPIATINLALDAIRNPKVLHDEVRVKRYLRMISDENKRMHAQVENVLRISQLEKKQLDIKKEKMSLHDLIEDAIPHVELLIEDRGGYIKAHLNATNDVVLVNESHFTNVIVNILDNAIKYSPNTPEIDVYTENDNHFITLKITDKGAGMSKLVQKKIFEKFYREHTGNIHNIKGHGLGLAYVKQIVDDHNGQIMVTSEKGKEPLLI